MPVHRTGLPGSRRGPFSAVPAGTPPLTPRALRLTKQAPTLPLAIIFTLTVIVTVILRRALPPITAIIMATILIMLTNRLNHLTVLLFQPFQTQPRLRLSKTPFLVTLTHTPSQLKSTMATAEQKTKSLPLETSKTHATF